MDETIKKVCIGVVSAGLGFAIGYKIAEKKLAERFEERLAEETKGMREFYSSVKQKYSTPEEAVKELIPEPSPEDPRVKKQKTQYNKIVKEEEYIPDEFESKEVPEPVVQNVFEMGPVIIDQEVFMANDPDHEQATLTYYAASDQVCGEKDEPIDNADLVVGTEFKKNFGKGSSDNNIVHIRNVGLHMDFEVVKSEGSYEAEVLGMVDDSVPPHKRHRIG